MGKVLPENYITIQGWMVTELKLKGNELLIYAIIYGFSQDGNYFFGSQQYMSEWTGTSKNTVRTAVKNLVDSGLVEKIDFKENGVKFCKYRARQLPEGVVKNFSYQLKNLSGGSSKIYPNNKSIDNKNNNIRQNAEEVVKLFNKICTDFPKVVKLTDARARTINSRLQDTGLDDIRGCFEKAQKSDFLTGRNSNGWKASFDWLMKPANMTKVLEGNYDNRGKQSKATGFSNFKQRSTDYDELERQLIAQSMR